MFVSTICVFLRDFFPLRWNGFVNSSRIELANMDLKISLTVNNAKRIFNLTFSLRFWNFFDFYTLKKCPYFASTVSVLLQILFLLQCNNKNKRKWKLCVICQRYSQTNTFWKIQITFIGKINSVKIRKVYWQLTELFLHWSFNHSIC